ncbi:hypothetical protein ACFWVC_23290 [Streptomyces sp. NPDC058691]|uniref:hypothetical protein n=1 Tax=Streptomyces sp. NPDC058691 TaxID=3346601 RepID=UPI0036568396
MEVSVREDCALSVEEVRALKGIEGLLGRDRELARRLRAIRRLRTRRRDALLVTLLGGSSLALLPAAAMTKNSPLLWAFAVSWAATLLSATRSQRLPGRMRRA